MKRIQLTSAEKLRQMNEKYSGADLKSVTNKAKSKIDLQGWRNHLINSIVELSVKNVLDIGSGTGDKMLRLSNIYTSNSNYSIVDFAQQSQKIKDYLFSFGIKSYQSDIFEFINNANLEKYDLITMFGFVHEIKDHKKLASELKKICYNDVTILISDNSLYKSVSELHSAFNKEFPNVVSYASKSYFNIFHIFKKNSGLGPRWFWRIQFGRVDDILLLVGNVKILEKMIKRIR
jgi:ubiquinone/menaquinone biosynthesis C-methylase UbiE